MLIAFALIGVVLGFVPGGSFLLIPLELFLIYRIAESHRAFEFGSFLAMGSAIVVISGFLKGLASLLHAIPGIGQMANSVVAFGFIMIIGTLAERYYASRTRPNVVP
ncbi:MAG TPA: hypothetical protein VF618_02990 [Thermoanaerobaculia bacterium]